VPKRRWFSLVAGGIAGGVEATVTYPTEYVKTQLQLQDGAKGVKVCMLIGNATNEWFIDSKLEI
jgi:hypothetical protein